MQNKMECDWFKPSKHELLNFKPNKKSQQIFFVFSASENKMREMHNGMPSK